MGSEERCPGHATLEAGPGLFDLFYRYHRVGLNASRHVAYDCSRPGAVSLEDSPPLFGARRLKLRMSSQKTYSPKAADVERAWHLVDATDLPLGRLASEIAGVLKGKNKPI